jgi:hypothetical protein
MIRRNFPDLFTGWRGIVDELAYNWPHEDYDAPLKWGVCMSYPECVEVTFDDALLDRGLTMKDRLHLDMSSYTKSRWTRFMRRYFRPDFGKWIDESMEKLQRYPRRPFVASYSISYNVYDINGRIGHNYGGCLASLQIRICPKPMVMLFSRACQVDKIGFLDFALMHLVAKRMGVKPVSAQWVVSLPFISAVSQTYYTLRFGLGLRTHVMRNRVIENLRLESSTYGPLERTIKRLGQWKNDKFVPGSKAVKDLSLEFELPKEKKKKILDNSE